MSEMVGTLTLGSRIVGTRTVGTWTVGTRTVGARTVGTAMRTGGVWIAGARTVGVWIVGAWIVGAWTAPDGLSEAARKLGERNPVELPAACEANGTPIPNFFVLRIGPWRGYYRCQRRNLPVATVGYDVLGRLWAEN